MTEILSSVGPQGDRHAAGESEVRVPEEMRQAGSRTGSEIEAVAEVAVALERARGASGPARSVVVTDRSTSSGKVSGLLGVRT